MTMTEHKISEHQRYVSLDILKAIGIIYLIILHQIIWLFIKDDTGGLFFEEASGIVLGYFSRFGIHAFGGQLPLLAGTTFFLALHSKYVQWNDMLKRTLLLAALGFLMNVLTWGFDDFFDWDILQFLALSFLIIFPILKIFSRRKAMIILTIAGFTALCLSEYFPILDYHKNYLYIIIFGDVIGGHYWPLLPWFSLVVCGIWAGRVLLKNNTKELIILASVGSVLLCMSIVSGKFLPPTDLSHVWGPALFSPSPYFVCGMMGFGFLGISLLELSFKHFPQFKSMMERSFLIYYGQGILWIYLATTMIGFNVTEFLTINVGLNYQQSLKLLPILIMANLLFGFVIGKLISLRKKINYQCPLK